MTTSRPGPGPDAPAALRLPESDTELVLTTQQDYAPAWLVASADQAAETIQTAGGRVLTEPISIPVGRLAVAADPFGNVLVLLDPSEGTYTTDAAAPSQVQQRGHQPNVPVDRR